MSKRILVTGGAGFIGSHLVDALVKKGHSVRIIDNLEPQVHVKPPDYLNPEAQFIKGDIRNESDVKKSLKNIDVLFHFAAMVGVGQSMYQIERYTGVNTYGTAIMLDAVVNGKFNMEKIIVASSMSIYGEGTYACRDCDIVYPRLRNVGQMEKGDWEMNCPSCGKKVQPLPTGEEKPLYPTSVYAINKRDHEELCLSVGRAYNIPAVALRFFNTYGTRQSLSNPYTGVAAIFLSRIKNGQPPLIFEDGQQIRDFVSVHDIVRSCLLAMEKSEANYEVFNVGSGKSVSINDISQVLIKLCGKKITPTITGKYRAGDIRHCVADITKIKNKLGYKPATTLEKGMKELMQWGETAFALDKTGEAQSALVSKKLIL